MTRSVEMQIPTLDNRRLRAYTVVVDVPTARAASCHKETLSGIKCTSTVLFGIWLKHIMVVPKVSARILAGGAPPINPSFLEYFRVVSTISTDPE